MTASGFSRAASSHAALTVSGSSPAFTYSCSGSQATVLSSRALIGSAIALSNLTSTTAGATDYLRLTLSFPSVAGNTLQGLSSTVSFLKTEDSCGR